MKRIALLSFFAAACGVPEVPGPDWDEVVSPSPAPAQSPPRLHVDGVTLRTPAGAEVRLRGLNVCSLEFDSTGAGWRLQPDGGSETLDALAARDRWRATVVRVPVNQEWFVTDDAYVARVEQVIDAAAMRGVYVVLDLQWEHAQATEPYHLNILKRPTFGFGNTSEAFWHRAAGRWSNRDNLLFDLINEPHDVAPELLAVDFQRLIDRLARRAPQTPLVIGAPDWAHDLSYWRAHPLAGANLIYAAHQYLPYDPPSTFDAKWGRAAAELPVFVAEFDTSGAVVEGVAFHTALIDAAERAGVDGWMPWALGCGLELDGDTSGVGAELSAQLRALNP